MTTAFRFANARGKSITHLSVRGARYRRAPVQISPGLWGTDLEGMGVGAEARPASRERTNGEAVPSSRKKFGSRRRAKAKVTRSTFCCFEAIIPRQAEGSPRACHRSILAKKKASPRSAQDKARSPELGSATKKVSLGLSRHSPSPRELCSPNAAPTGLGWGNTAAQN
jgi:hypothetical protein